MSQEPMRAERFLIVARVTSRQLPSFPAKGWVAVEVFQDETAARERFHALRTPLEDMKLGAVLIRALTSSTFERIAYEKTIISKDADFWDLQSAEITRASRQQQDEWNAGVERVLHDREERRHEAEKAAVAARAGQASRPSASRQSIMVAAGSFAIVLAVGLAFVLRSEAPGVDASLAKARDGTTTLILADPNDPRIMVEYVLRPDGSRTVVRRITRDDMASSAYDEANATSPAGGEGGRKNLVEAINGFFAFRK
jgi:hypothetical protein